MQEEAECVAETRTTPSFSKCALDTGLILRRLCAVVGVMLINTGKHPVLGLLAYIPRRIKVAAAVNEAKTVFSLEAGNILRVISNTKSDVGAVDVGGGVDVLRVVCERDDVVGFCPADGLCGVGGNIGGIRVAADIGKVVGVVGTIFIENGIAIKNERHLFPCDTGVRLEGCGGRASDKAMVACPADWIIVVLIGRNIGKAGGNFFLGVSVAVQDGDEHAAGHGQIRAEHGVAGALHVAVVDHEIKGVEELAGEHAGVKVVVLLGRDRKGQRGGKQTQQQDAGDVRVMMISSFSADLGSAP